MELVQELFVTVVIAVLFSFVIAKLVSLGDGGGGGDSSTHKNSQLSSRTQNVDQPNNNNTKDIDQIITEDLSYHEKLEVEGLKSEKRVDELFQESKLVKDDEVIETECSELPQILLTQEKGVKEEEDNLVKENREIETVGFEECSVQNDVVKEGEEEKKPEEIMECEANNDEGEEKMKKKIGIMESDSDDDWEGIERSELEKMFAKATKFVEDSQDEGLEMELYGLRKVATEGPCREQPPMPLKLAARAKWNAWQRLGNMNPEVAMEQYIALVSEKVPGWTEDNPGNDEPGSSEEENPGALPSDLSTSSPHHSNVTKERNPEVMPDNQKDDLTRGPNLDSRAK